MDNTGAPFVDANTVTKEKFITPDLVNIVTPNAIVGSPKGTFYVSSVYNGVIAEFDANGVFVRRILSPAVGDELPFPHRHAARASASIRAARSTMRTSGSWA